MIIGVPKETAPCEKRVALIPAVIPSLQKGGMEVHIESGAGVESGYPDAAYTEKGGTIVASRRQVLNTPGFLCKSERWERTLNKGEPTFP